MRIGPAAARPGRERRLTYVLERFPADTLNFVYNEIAGLETAGWAIEIWSLMPSVVCPEEARPYLRRTRNVLPLRPGLLLRALRHYLGRRPLALLGLLRLPWDNEAGRLRKAIRTCGHLLYGLQFAYLVRDSGAHVHAHFAYKAATAALVAGRLNGTGFSFTAHGSATVRPQDRYCLRSKVAGASFVVAVSEYNRRALQSVCPGCPPERIIVNRTGVLLDQFPYRDPVARPDGPFRLACVGSLYRVKNHEGLLRACALLAQRGIPFRLSLAGKDDEGRQATLAAEAAALGIGERVEFLGLRDHGEILSLLRETDLFVLASHSEGIPVAVMEAMAAGVPVLAPRVTGVPELVEDGRDGLLASPADPAEYARKMEQALRDPALRLAMARAARRRIEEQYDMVANAKRLAGFLEARLTAPGPGAPSGAAELPQARP